MNLCAIFFGRAAPARSTSSDVHGSDLELRIIEQREVDLPAHGRYVSLVEKELGGMSPAIAVLGLLMREGQYVVGSLANGAKDGAVLRR